MNSFFGPIIYSITRVALTLNIIEINNLKSILRADVSYDLNSNDDDPSPEFYRYGSNRCEWPRNNISLSQSVSPASFPKGDV